MGLKDYKKNLLLLGLVFLFTACQKPEELLISLLKNQYANLYVNNEPHKREVIQQLETYFKTHSLSSENEHDISLFLNQINDGHVHLKNKLAAPSKHSDLKMVPGTFFIKECENSCIPKIPEGKYEILEVDGMPFSRWLSLNEREVYASSPWGRRFRTSRLLTSNKLLNHYSLKYKNTKGVVFSSQVISQLIDRSIDKCVEGKRLNPKTFQIIIKTLWCDNNRLDLTKNFISEWDKMAERISAQDKIIIDLRENNGGDDKELMYALNAFIKNAAPIYHYQYLNVNQPGKLEKIMHLLPFKFKLWGPKGIDYIDTSLKPKHTFYENKLSVLISAGCFSSCEGLAAGFKNLTRAKLWGTKTHGGAGEPVFFDIPKTTYSINLPTCVTWQGNKELIEGIGVSPHQTFEDSLNLPGDALLSAAIND